jgi:CubicO group peptidase (beta-lactamase class C family)
MSSASERVLERFRKQHLNGSFPGGQLVVRHRGELILDHAIGLARGFQQDESTSPTRVAADTLFPAYSCGKPIAALAIALLEERGLIALRTPLGTMFPECRGKSSQSATILDVLTHRAGLHLPDALDHIEAWSDHRDMVQQIFDAPPKYPVGTLAYAPWEFGWIVAEIVRRVTGTSFDEFVAREVFQPLGLRNIGFGLRGLAANAIARAYWLGDKRVIVAGTNVAERFEEIHNDARYFESKNPACALVTTAGDLALLYDFLLRGGLTHDGLRLISSGILHQYTTKNVFGFDRSLKTFLSLGRGFVLGTWAPSMFGWWNSGRCFGHAGVFSCLAGADPRRQLSFAVLTNGNRGLADFSKRFIPLIHLLRRCFD